LAVYENVARTHSQAVREGRKLMMSTVSETLQRKMWMGVEVVDSF